MYILYKLTMKCADLNWNTGLSASEAYYDLPCMTKNRLHELTNSIQQCSQCTDLRRSYMYEEKIA